MQTKNSCNQLENRFSETKQMVIIKSNVIRMEKLFNLANVLA